MTERTFHRGRIQELDVLRGIAALGVVVWHYGAHFNALPLKTLLFPFYSAGFLLVDFFFVLSGYVIARAYWREARQGHFAMNVWARLARLYPLHLLTLIVTAALILAIPSQTTSSLLTPETIDVKHFLLNILLLNQIGFQDGWSFNTPAWSISTEFIVNVAFLAFISMTVKVRAIASLAFIVVAVAMAVSQRSIVSDEFLFGFLDLNLVRCAVGFGSGVAIYLCMERLGGASMLVGRTWLTNLLGAVSLVSLVALMISAGRQPPIWYYFASIIISTGCIIFVPLSPLLGKLLRGQLLSYLGEISYSTYLVHYPIQLALYLVSLRMEVDFNSPLTLVLYGAIVIGISAFTHKYVEMAAQRHMLSIATRKGVMVAH